MVQKVLLVHLVLLATQVHLVCRACLEKGEVLDFQALRVTRVNQEAKVVMDPLGKMDQEVLQVPLDHLVQLVNLEIRVKAVPLGFQV